MRIINIYIYKLLWLDKMVTVVVDVTITWLILLSLLIHLVWWVVSNKFFFVFLRVWMCVWIFWSLPLEFIWLEQWLVKLDNAIYKMNSRGHNDDSIKWCWNFFLFKNFRQLLSNRKNPSFLWKLASHMSVARALSISV